MTRRGIFTSDFHMFSDRSIVESILPDLEQAAGNADLIVLGGDIVDFKWSRLPDQEHTEQAALEWFQDFSDRHRGKQIVYLIGNHDWTPSYLTRLNLLAETNQHIQVFEYWYQQGDALFLHGDVVHSRPNQEALEHRRSTWSGHGQRGRLQNSLYSLVFLLRLPLFINWLINREHRICRHLTRYLQNERLLPDRGIRRIFFGHTHTVIKGYELEGLVFYNSGAPLKNLGSEILEFEIQGDFSDGR